MTVLGKPATTKRGPPALPKEDPKRFKTSDDEASPRLCPTTISPTTKQIYGNHLDDFLLCHEEEFPAWVNANEEEERLFEDRIIADLERRNQREESLSRAWSSFQGAQGRKLSLNDTSSSRSRVVEHTPARAARDIDETPQRDNRRRHPSLDDLLEAAPYLRYSWKALHLGTHLGTPAYNQHNLQTAVGPTESLMPFQISQIVQSLRPQTVFLPPESELNVFVQQSRFENEESEDNESDSPQNNLMRSLGRLYKEMCRQDADDWSTTYRRQANHWTASAVKAKLQTMENEINELQHREKQVLKRSR
jgi:hypothetical protein